MPSLRGLIIETTGGSVHSHHRGKRDAVPPKSPTVKGRPTLRQQASILSIWRDSIEKRCELHETCGNSPYTDIMRSTRQKWKCARKCIRFLHHVLNVQIQTRQLRRLNEQILSELLRYAYDKSHFISMNNFRIQV